MFRKVMNAVNNAVVERGVCVHCEETSSPPSSMPSPSPLPLPLRVRTGLVEEGGTRLSKFNFRLASRAAAGVLPATGVLANDPCAGLGVTFTKSAKLKLVVPGVFGPKPRKPAPLMPGVMCDDGNGVDLHGGVDGGWTTVLVCCIFAVDGDVARWRSKSAPSSPVFGVRDHETLCTFFIRRSGGGVCGGDEVMRVEALMVKLWTGRSASSSSLNSGDGGSSGIVEPSEMKERWVGLLEGKRACLAWLIGDDSGKLCFFFQETCRADATLVLRPVAGPEDGDFCRPDGRTLLLL